MSGPKWRAEIDALNSILGAVVTAESARVQLVATWDTLSRASHAVSQGFASLPAEKLEARANALADQLIADNKSPKLHPDSAVAAGEQLGVLLRALESTVRQLNPAQVVRRPEDLLVEVGDRRFYLLPNASRNRGRPPADSSEGGRRSLFRRGLVDMRVIPQELPGGRFIKMAVVRPELAPDKGVSFAGCLFPKVDFEQVGGIDGFQAAGLLPADTAETALASLEQCFLKGATVVVFPELCVLPKTREDLQGLLLTKPWEAAAPSNGLHTPTLVLAGSWHESENGLVRNSCHVFDGNGMKLGIHHKNVPYRTDGVIEIIDVDDHILTLFCVDTLYAVGICIDYCVNDDRPNPYDSLDVDYILVPSCGDDKTLDAHQKQIHRNEINRKSVGFVTQQEYPSKPGRFGTIILGKDIAVTATESVVIVP